MAITMIFAYSLHCFNSLCFMTLITYSSVVLIYTFILQKNSSNNKCTKKISSVLMVIWPPGGATILQIYPNMLPSAGKMCWLKYTLGRITFKYFRTDDIVHLLVPLVDIQVKYSGLLEKLHGCLVILILPNIFLQTY